MQMVKEKILDAFLTAGVPYGKDSEQSIRRFDKALKDALPDEESYLRMEELLSAALAEQEEDAFWYGFKEGILLMALIIRADVLS